MDAVRGGTAHPIIIQGGDPPLQQVHSGGNHTQEPTSFRVQGCLYLPIEKLIHKLCIQDNTVSPDAPVRKLFPHLRHGKDFKQQVTIVFL